MQYIKSIVHFQSLKYFPRLLAYAPHCSSPIDLWCCFTSQFASVRCDVSYTFMVLQEVGRLAGTPCCRFSLKDVIPLVLKPLSILSSFTRFKAGGDFERTCVPIVFIPLLWLAYFHARPIRIVLFCSKAECLTNQHCHSLFSVWIT